VAYGTDGFLAVADANGNTYVWNTATGSVTATLTPPEGEHSQNIAYGPNGTIAVADTACSGACLGGSVPSAVYVWNIAADRVIAVIPLPEGEPPTGVAFGSDGTVAVADANGYVYLSRVSTAQ
jgi:DNA-binding beta-propeller fold protein YncE